MSYLQRQFEIAISINHYPAPIAWFVLLTVIRWIAIYPVDSVIQPLNNRALVFTSGHQSVTPFLGAAPLNLKNISWIRP